MKLDKDLQKASKKNVMDVYLLVDKDGNIESEGKNLDEKDEKNLDYLNTNLYSHIIAITYTNWKKKDVLDYLVFFILSHLYHSLYISNDLNKNKPQHL